MLTCCRARKAVTRLKATQFESAGKKAAASPEVTFAQLRDRYLKTIGNGAVENIYTLRLTQTVADAVKRVSA